MTIIFQFGNNFWIESHALADQAVASGGFFDSRDNPVDRAGNMIGYTILLRSSFSDVAGTPVIFTGAAGGTLYSFGVYTELFRAFNLNQAAVLRTYGLDVILFMRGSGR